MNTDNGSTREICKSGWLKKMPPQERRLSVMTPFSKLPKVEKAWVSFCVHDCADPFLEFYENRRSAFSHNPVQKTSLCRCLHVSPSIRVQGDNEHVFAITLQDRVIKLGANSREKMIEWIDALRSKLREMVILTPKDNLYSKEPEGGLRSPLLRNPNSPLPPPPTPIFQFPSTSLDFREDISGLNRLRAGSSLANSMTLSVASLMSSLSSMHNLNGNGIDNINNSSPSVVTYSRDQVDGEKIKNRRSSFRQSLPGSPTTPNNITTAGTVTFVRSPPISELPVVPREHVTVINVPSKTASVFTFDTLNAALESAETSVNVDIPLGYGESGFNSNQQFALNDSNALHLRIGNSLGSLNGAGCSAGIGDTQRPSVHSSMRLSGYGSWYAPNSQRTEVEGNYEPLFFATSDLPSNTSTYPLPQGPNSSALVRRRSEHRRSGKREQGRRSASVGPSIAPRQQPYQVGTDGRLMSLREQQVVRLHKEIAHKAGVRLTLRRKDCINSVAFVNCFNQVFVAGWKQREHPYLHNTFHIGDRLLSLGGVPVTTAAEAQHLIGNDPSLMVEFIILRIPYGKVFALKRETEGQPLGIIREGNTAEIREIVPGGLAFQHGVPSRAQTVDGISTSSWVLTEINHRPLNLFFKHSEIFDRLNAVGRDISILIQPMDLIKQLKRQLKLIRNYKDYIVM